jgi:putative membrane protein
MLPITKQNTLAMKKLNLIIGAALLAGSLQACHNGAKDSAQTADSINAVHDTTKTDTSKHLAGVPDDDDAKFAVKASAGGLTEIALSKLALAQSTDKYVTGFASMMIMEHTKAGAKLAALAISKNITVPTAPDSSQQKTINDLSAKTGKKFDMAYIDQMITDHKNTISLFEDEQKNAKDADIKAFATNTLPTLHKHLDAINAVKIECSKM